MLSKQKLNQIFLKDTSFVNLMTRRVFNILILANPYDAFMLEDDGRIDEKLFDEYAALSLRYPPRFMLAASAEEAWGELERTPFDLVEGESEIIAGPFTEYSGMRWALFFLAEYANLLTAAILATTFFLGGYSGPSFLPGFVWFGLKAVFMVLLIMWFRWTFPRTRVDQILTFGWKVLVPLSILNVVLTGALMFWFGIV